MSFNDKIIGFVDFLYFGRGQNVMTNNILSIHVESGNISYQNLNSSENFYSFPLPQQDETKSIVPKQVSYNYSFEKYIKSYLPSFSIDKAEKYDL